ncbi:hypothetical protein AALO_G00064870 [Alosa alosa]|uniref:Uncharacterized protein n=1 Tax=Alosa alosa TaxID=278164 RepID=A0AAV6H0P0_9TELE|nr:hypothetical protein AALO_G00064870 [Alosa alosa]
MKREENRTRLEGDGRPLEDGQRGDWAGGQADGRLDAPLRAALLMKHSGGFRVVSETGRLQDDSLVIIRKRRKNEGGFRVLK